MKYALIFLFGFSALGTLAIAKEEPHNTPELMAQKQPSREMMLQFIDGEIENLDNVVLDFSLLTKEETLLFRERFQEMVSEAASGWYRVQSCCAPVDYAVTVLNNLGLLPQNVKLTSVTGGTYIYYYVP